MVVQQNLDITILVTTISLPNTDILLAQHFLY
jgi:hypothetical protein